ncbi:hydrolase [Marinobacterium zhoushanense]|uniref:Hydrolase n=1 Tax=Marinobacterium zhoushanense TaxID=1679163 RepID=A0ABQ1KPG8_9GAMM|nr:hydrolase [Marinobacterium zhoushanense]GGC03186.1 hydrolase [Marinobacterium zhoushanense]
MLIHPDRSLLLLVDIQERLAPAIDDAQQLIDNCCWLTDVANRLHIPVIASEQYPQGLGPTFEVLRRRLPDEQIFSKQAFSCASEPECAAAIEQLKMGQIIIAGMETHVCVLQTALELKQQAREVFVVEDCVGSRTPANKAAGIERLRQNGVQIVTREMVAFEWLRKAGNDRFREISREFLR